MNLNQDYEQIDALYQRLNERADKLYEFVLLYTEYMYTPRDYGDGTPMKMSDIHVLTYIHDHPGMTNAMLNKETGKNKAAVSHAVKTLVERGLVEKQMHANNSKSIYLYATDAGVKLSRAHKLFDVIDIGQTMNRLQQSCTAEEIDTFYKVISVYIDILKEE